MTENNTSRITSYTFILYERFTAVHNEENFVTYLIYTYFWIVETAGLIPYKNVEFAEKCVHEILCDWLRMHNGSKYWWNILLRLSSRFDIHILLINHLPSLSLHFYKQTVFLPVKVSGNYSNLCRYRFGIVRTQLLLLSMQSTIILEFRQNRFWLGIDYLFNEAIYVHLIDITKFSFRYNIPSTHLSLKLL